MPASSSAQRTRTSRTRPCASGGTQRNALSLIIVVFPVSFRSIVLVAMAAAARRASPTSARSLSGCLRLRRAGRPPSPVILVAVVALHPVHEVAVLGLVAPLGHHVEPAIDRQEHLRAAAVGGIGVIDRAVVVLIENADARKLVHLGIVLLLEIVEPAPRARARREGDVIVEVEVASARGHPAECPAHPLAIGLKLCDRRARDRDEADVVMLEMLPRAVDLIREQRAAGASLLPVGAEHEVIDDELAASVE